MDKVHVLMSTKGILYSGITGITLLYFTHANSECGKTLQKHL